MRSYLVQDLTLELCSGPLVALEVSGPEAVARVREIVGPRDVEVGKRVRCVRPVRRCLQHTAARVVKSYFMCRGHARAFLFRFLHREIFLARAPAGQVACELGTATPPPSPPCTAPTCPRTAPWSVRHSLVALPLRGPPLAPPRSCRGPRQGARGRLNEVAAPAGCWGTRYSPHMASMSPFPDSRILAELKGRCAREYLRVHRARPGHVYMISTCRLHGRLG